MAHNLSAYRQASGGGGKRIPAAKIVSWLEANFTCKPRRNGEEITICSPFDGDTGFNFNINPEKGSCHSWRGDEWAGPINPDTGKRNCSFLKFVKLFRKCSYPEAAREVLGASVDLKSFLRPENRHSTAEPVRKIAVALPEGTDRLTDSPDPQAKLIRNWLRHRGYDDADIDKNDIHHLAMECFWPYYEFDTLVYWQSRNRFNKIYRFPDITIYEKGGNVLGETEGSKGDFLYGFDDCENASYVIVTESIFGKHTLIDQTLASGGAVLTAAQIGKIRILGPRKGVILSPDNDGAGIKSVFSNAKLLGVHGYPMFYSIPPKLKYEKSDGTIAFTKDWNELITDLKMSRTEVRELHDKGIMKATMTNMMKLYEQLPKKDKAKRVDL